MKQLLNQIKAAIRAELASVQPPRTGTIVAYNPTNATVRVALEPTGAETGWIPLKSVWVGNGWGAAFGPSLGDPVEITFEGGDIGAPSAGLRFFNVKLRAPVAQSGECALVSKAGSLIKMTADGNVTINAAQDVVVQSARDITATVGRDLMATVTRNADLTAQQVNVTAPQSTFTGNVTINGLLTTAGFACVGATGITSATFNIAIESTANIHTAATITGDTDVIAAGKSGATHHHNDPQGGTVGPPI